VGRVLVRRVRLVDPAPREVQHVAWMQDRVQDRRPDLRLVKVPCMALAPRRFGVALLADTASLDKWHCRPGVLELLYSRIPQTLHKKGIATQAFCSIAIRPLSDRHTHYDRSLPIKILGRKKKMLASCSPSQTRFKQKGCILQNKKKERAPNRAQWHTA
jgi:hypothetical protein